MKKRWINICLALTLTTGPSLMIETTAQATGRGPCSADRYDVTRSTPTDVRERKMRALIRCAFTRFGIPEEIDTAFVIAQRESGFNPWAKNPNEAAACRPWSETSYGSCGIYQELSRFHSTRVRAYLRERWFPRTWPEVPILQARANVLIAALMVRARGWCDWTAPDYCGG